ncbi:MAG: PAS domain S-box protein [Bryobacteraceae bacterium]|nr:PAS domain S-box protein [Bryobacteraceae bacterium]
MRHNEARFRKSPDWATDSNFYRFQVVQATQYAMFILDTEGIILSWNAGVQNILGYSEEEWLGKHASFIFTPADQAYDICAAEMKLAGEKEHSADIRWHLRSDGTHLFAHGFMTAVRAPDGTLLGYSKILTDETKNKQLQDALTESNMALEQFAYVASHDLQEPLRTISAFAELLNRRYKDKLDAEAVGFLDLIVKGAKRMGTLIQDLLAYARVTTEVDRPSSYSLDENLETALSQLRGLIEETQATVTHDPLPMIQADQGQMVRLFQNLVGNALKYRNPELAPVVHVTASQEKSEWVIKVNDNGIGFEPKFAKEIFRPFKRLHGEDRYSGTGVGLAICQRIVEAHGGRIWAESFYGKGSSFQFSLPFEGKAPGKHTEPVTKGL